MNIGHTIAARICKHLSKVIDQGPRINILLHCSKIIELIHLHKLVIINALSNCGNTHILQKH